MSSAAVQKGFVTGPYPERDQPKLSWLDRNGERAIAPALRRLRGRLGPAREMAARVAEREPAMQELDASGLRELSLRLRGELHHAGFRPELVAESFALIREVAQRTLGKRPYDVQVMGGYVLLQGMVAEMETGEGKTLTATLPAATAALAGLPVHVITVNDYLVGRDAELMRPVYSALGLSVGAIREGMKPDERREQYARDVTYCCNKELAFDYLRDRIALGRCRNRTRLELERLVRGSSRSDGLVLRGLCFGIVDEADSVLVDEAKTPLIISAGKEIDDVEEEVYDTAVQLASRLEPEIDFEINERERAIRLTDSGEELLEELAQELRGVWKGPNRRSQFVAQALSALHLFERDKHYLVNDGKVQIVDEYTGRLMPDRSWERGLHQMVEAKEGCEITGHTDAQAKISYQRFFRRYRRLAGMTGTAREVAGELWNVYGLATVTVPTHRPVQRRDFGRRVHATSDERWAAVVDRIEELSREGRAVLVGTRSVAASEQLSGLLDARRLSHQVLNARQDAEEAAIVARAGEPGRVTVATNMAGRGTDIVLAPATREAGGLHVIATERHEARRIDRQLFGRCGRQGDPGSFEEIVSLQDELVRAHAAPMAAAASAQGTHARSRVRLAAVRVAQRRAEALHAKLRRRLLELDESEFQRLAFSGRGE